MLRIWTFTIFCIEALCCNLVIAQTAVLIAPSDVVISKNYSFDFSKLRDHNDLQFGTLHDHINKRDSVTTEDLVCIAFCLPNPYLKYPGLNINFPIAAPSKACELYNQHYDSTQIEKTYLLDWGLDGYYEAINPDSIQLIISDLRIDGVGAILRIYKAFDGNVLIASSTQTIWIIDCDCIYDPNFKCLDKEVKIYLTNNCKLTILPEMLLDSTIIKPCNDYLVVELKDWITNQKIDREVNMPGAQVDYRDKGRTIQYFSIDPLTGKKCSGELILLDTLAPVIYCHSDTIVNCAVDTRPYKLGIPLVTENCNDYILNYIDQVVRGGCVEGYEQIITRKWIATDNSGNKTECQYQIKVSLLSINEIILPPDFDGTDRNVLNCDEAYNKTFDINSHITNSPFCIDGFLLDSVFWYANPLEPNIYPNRRLPRVLGWNRIEAPLDPNFGHPSPKSIFYPTHKNWSFSNPLCWGFDQHILWEGTGFPTGIECTNLNISYRDSIVDKPTPNCTSSNLSCSDIYREWTVLDWCTLEVLVYTQKISITDLEGPAILYPDTVRVIADPSNCKGRWDVLVPWLLDNCSNEIHYIFSSSAGDISGNEINGFVLSNLLIGIYTGSILASDCCGNISNKQMVIIVEENTPPLAVCGNSVKVSIVGNQSPGKNYAKLFANGIDNGSTGNCDKSIYFKIIRMDQLNGTSNGSNDSIENTSSNCVAINGDDNFNLDGTQIYFDDAATFCCSEVGNKILVVMRVFDHDPGLGPVLPASMDPGGALYNHFSDCVSSVEVLDKSVPTLVPPPNMVVSCSFPIDIAKLSDPLDSTFGKIVSDLSFRRKVVSYDNVCINYCVKNEITGYPGPVNNPPPSSPPVSNRACDYYNSLYDSRFPDRFYEMVWGFDGYVLSACENIPEIQVTDFRKGGQGKITRRIVAYGPNGITVTATQVIWVVDCKPFYINSLNSCDSLDDVIWPGNCNGEGIILDACGDILNPDNPLLGKPILINNRNCNLITTDYVDTFLLNQPEGCVKLIRTWTIIDWNQYDPTFSILDGKWTYQQTIVINDTEVPDLTTMISVQSALDSGGLAKIDLVATMIDNCTPANELQVSYQIDELNDGTGKYSGGYDYKVSALNKREFAEGKKPLIADNQRAFDSNQSWNASGKYPVGIHKISWSVLDACGNAFDLERFFEIKEIVGTEDSKNNFNELQIVPNPSNGNFKIISKQNIDFIQLIPITGLETINIEVPEKKWIEINGILSGLYFVKAFRNGRQMAIAKIMVID